MVGELFVAKEAFVYESVTISELNELSAKDFAVIEGVDVADQRKDRWKSQQMTLRFRG